ncbi:Hypothetical protein NTJ_14437 [Nesidiocoris tenuis]|uniref:Uncharacterized protein n=1 Tax=Nesidiocoris tenuis TaxID=355587 RepID=A0ABN7BB56_9HEMI|nr:Hypothetical protein NTJ_14437 [Nesidiocoris tenuis]
MKNEEMFGNCRWFKERRSPKSGTSLAIAFSKGLTSPSSVNVLLPTTDPPRKIIAASPPPIHFRILRFPNKKDEKCQKRKTTEGLENVPPQMKMLWKVHENRTVMAENYDLVARVDGRALCRSISATIWIVTQCCHFADFRCGEKVADNTQYLLFENPSAVLPPAKA